MTDDSLEKSRELDWLAKVAWLLDDAIRVPILGWRIGLDPLLGLIPGAGDAVAALMALSTLTAALRHGIPGITIARMGVNIALDYVIGLIPFLGDLGDFGFKSNRKNLELLRRHAASPRKASKSDYLVVAGVAAGLAALFAGGVWVMLLLVRAVLGL